MPNIDTMTESKYLRKEDVGDAGDSHIVTIVGLKKANVAREDDEPEIKWIMKVREFTKPIVMNGTNLKLCAMILSTKETDEWRGKQVEIYHDPAVTFGDRLVGGIRFRKMRVDKPKRAQEAQSTDDWGTADETTTTPQKKPGNSDDFDSDIPF